ncbi:type II secretion system F family protein [Viridibacterium curvum]|uniref:Type II secretion system F family protein n=1 Tax=Viridibacterium curvum TaxID=1101404 RepID=A0ABP9QKU7_9RHOO
MTRYFVKALDARMVLSEMHVDSGSEAELRAQLDARGLSVLSISLAPLALGGSRSRFPLQLFCQELLALLQSGLPLVEAIDTLAEREARPAVRSTLDALLTALRNGQTFSTALQAQGSQFPELFIAMLRAAERTSDLDQALARYIAYRQQTDALRDKMVSAAIYPLTLLGVGSLVVLFLLGYVVPRFSGVFEEAGGELPWASRLLIDWGKLMSEHALPMLGGLIAAVVAIVLFIRLPSTRASLARLAWKLPGLGERLRVFQLARFYRTMAMLLRGGITVIQGMEMSRELLATALRDRLDAAMAQIREGRSLSDTLAHHGLTTNVAQRLLRVGERSGSLGDMAERVAAFHEEEIARWVDWLTRLIGPLLMLVIGTVIGLIVVLMYLPIFQLAESIQ